jgi:hypothetical protein
MSPVTNKVLCANMTRMRFLHSIKCENTMHYWHNALWLIRFCHVYLLICSLERSCEVSKDVSLPHFTQGGLTFLLFCCVPGTLDMVAHLFLTTTPLEMCIITYCVNQAARG